MRRPPYRPMAERRGIFGRDTIDNGEPGVDRRAVSRVGLAGNRRGKENTALLLQIDEAVAAGGIIRSDVVAGDRDEAAAVGKAREGGADMADRGVGEAHCDIRRGREGRVHQNDGRLDRGIEPVVDLLGVVAGDRGGAE